MNVDIDRLGEAATIDVPIAGTPFRLTHDTTRVPGYTEGGRLHVPLIDGDPPEAIERVELEVEVSGQVYTETFDPAPNLSTEFQWDGNDAYGRPVAGSQPVDYSVGYTYSASYAVPEDNDIMSFGGAGGNALDIPPRDEPTFWRGFNGDAQKIILSRPDARIVGQGGWQLDVRHDFDPATGVLRYGDGRRRVVPPQNAESSDGFVEPFAGIAPDAQVFNPTGCDVGPDGSLYVISTLFPPGATLRRLRPDGTAQTVAGKFRFEGVSALHNDADGDFATNANFRRMYDVAVDSAGRATVSVPASVAPEGTSQFLVQIDTDGRIRRWPSLGPAPAPNESEFARSLEVPKAVASGPDDELYVSRFNSGRGIVQRVGQDDTVELVAGSGAAPDGFADYNQTQEPHPATEVPLGSPTGLAVDGDGRLYIADSTYAVVFRVDTDGTIRVVAGTGNTGYSGDGGPATEARLNTDGRMDVATGSDGEFYVSDGQNSVVRRVDSNGTIETVVGTGASGYSGNGGPATEATFVSPRGLATDGTGGLFISDESANTVRYRTSDGTVEYRMGITESVSQAEDDVRNAYSSAAGDGGPATEATLGDADDIAFGPDGTLYLADRLNSVIRAIGTDGTISTVAGTGEAGYSGDGGLATRAQLDTPTGLTVGGDGSVYVADRGNGAVRRIRPDGTITTVTSGLQDPRAVTTDPDDRLYVALFNEVFRIESDGSQTRVIGGGSEQLEDGVATENLDSASTDDIVHDGENGLFVATGGRIYHAPFGGTVTVLAGKPSADAEPIDGVSISAARNIALGPDGSLFAIDGSAAIRGVGDVIRIARDESVTVVTKNSGYRTSLRFVQPTGLAVDAGGNVYVSDASLRAVRRLSIGQARTSDTQLVPETDGQRVFEFSEDGRHLRTYDALTGDAIYTFDYQDTDLVGITDRDGNETTIERTADGTPTAIVSPTGIRTELSLDSAGYISSITDPAGEQWNFSHDGGQVTAATDRSGETTTLSYTETGRLDSVTYPSGSTTSLTRSVSVTERSVTADTAGGRSQTTTMTVTPDGIVYADDTTGIRMTSTTDGATVQFAEATTTETRLGDDPRFGRAAPVVNSNTTTTGGGHSKALTGDRTVQLAADSDPLSVETLLTTTKLGDATRRERYTADDRTLTTTFPTGRTVVQSLGTARRPLRTEISDRETTEYDYEDGRVTARRYLADGETREWTASYDANGFYEQITDPRGETTTFETDAMGRQTATTRPDGATQSFGYDADGRITSVTPPGRSAHTIEYDADGYPSTYTPPGGDGSWSYTFDGDGYLTQRESPSGTVVAYSFDDAGRLTTVSLPRGTLSYSYDGESFNLTEIEGPDSTTLSASWDGPLQTEETLDGPVSGTISRTFDDLFQVTELSVDGQATIGYEYDADGLVTTAGDCSVERNDAGLATKATVGATTRTWSQTGFGNIGGHTATVAGKTVYDAAYERNERGWITRAEETVGGTTTVREFGYDAVGRLTEVRTDGTVTEAYEYGPNGNRTTVERDGETVSPSYDGRDRLQSAGDRSYEYDADGRVTGTTVAGETTTYEYGARGSLLRVTLPDGTEIGYETDPFGRRVGKRVDGNLERGWLYLDGLRPIAELDGDGTVRTWFVYATSQATPEYMVRDGTTYAFVWDHAGSPRLVVNADTGDVAQRIEYDAYGRVLEDTNPGFQPFGFAGGLYDPDTGLVRFGARDYDPVAGRFTAPDPLRFRGSGTNFYTYAAGDPVNATDRSGLLADPVTRGGIGGAIDAGIETVSQLVQHGEVKDWSAVARSAAIGAMTGAFGPLAKGAASTAKGKFAADMAVNAAGGAGGAVASNAAARAQGDWVSLADGVIKSAALSVGTGYAGSKASDKIDDVVASRRTQARRQLDQDAASNALKQRGNDEAADFIEADVRPDKRVTDGLDSLTGDNGTDAVDIASKSANKALGNATSGGDGGESSGTDGGWF